MTQNTETIKKVNLTMWKFKILHNREKTKIQDNHQLEK